MNKLWIALTATMILTGCGSEEVRQSSFDIQQRRQIAQENAAKEARVRQEQEDLARIRQQQRTADQSMQPAVNTQMPVIHPVEPQDFPEHPLPGPNGTLQDPETLLANRTIYYDYDAYNVKEDYRNVLEVHGKFLLSHKEVKLRIEGNCDERGSREYNLALGQRRADSVKRALTLLGVPAAQMEAVSFGSEKPKATTHDEQGYAENRRSDLVYVGSKSASK